MFKILFLFFLRSSLVYLNNESINIWSHLIGAGLFLYFLFRDIYIGNALPILSSTSDYYFVLFYTFSVIVSR
jgi:predicted membrane channel-forming protein YqfA (hemolysin III family)